METNLNKLLDALIIDVTNLFVVLDLAKYSTDNGYSIPDNHTWIIVNEYALFISAFRLPDGTVSQIDAHLSELSSGKVLCTFSHTSSCDYVVMNDEYDSVVNEAPYILSYSDNPIFDFDEWIAYSKGVFSK